MTTQHAPLTIDQVRQAADRIAPHVARTPLERSAALSELAGLDVWLKLECFQVTGSFKLRGALNALLTLDPADRERGVITASAGNHGIGIARAAGLLAIPATVVVPETASPAKVAALRSLSITLIQHGATYDEAEARALALARDRGGRFVSAYNDPAVIAGGGTIALEILADLPAARAVIVPTGGGGLISGVGLTVKTIDPTIAVYGVQSVASPTLHAAIAAGRIVEVPVGPSLADGLSGNLDPGSRTFDLIRRYVDRIDLVEEAEIAAAIRDLIDLEHVLVEGSAAVAWAALRSRRLPIEAGPVILILTGRNIAGEVVRGVLGPTAGH